MPPIQTGTISRQTLGYGELTEHCLLEDTSGVFRLADAIERRHGDDSLFQRLGHWNIEPAIALPEWAGERRPGFVD
jgi:hypothetical protein